MQPSFHLLRTESDKFLANDHLYGKVTMRLTRAEIKKVKALRTKKERQVTNQFVAEGVRLLEEANRIGARPGLDHQPAAQLGRRLALGSAQLAPPAQPADRDSR